MLAVSFLVLQACISFCSVSNKSGAFLFLPCSHKDSVADVSEAQKIALVAVSCRVSGSALRRPRFIGVTLRLTFPRAKLRRQIFMTRAEVWAKNWAKNWAKFSAHFRASFALQNDPQIFSRNSSQFITPCLVAEILKFLLRELLGFGGHK